MGDKTLLIVGASSAIGRELIREVADTHTTVLAHCNTGLSRIEDLAHEVPGRVLPLQADLSTAGGVGSLVSAVLTHCECPDGIVFLAAPPFALTRFKDLAWQDFQRQLDLQLRVACEVLGTFLPLMAKARHGKVVFMLSSYTQHIPPSAMAHYVTAKYAVLGLMKALSSEYAGKQICINAVSPSMVETDFLLHIPEKIVEITADQHPLKRNATPVDVAPAIKFLLSSGADFMTGVNLPVTGGS